MSEADKMFEELGYKKETRVATDTKVDIIYTSEDMIIQFKSCWESIDFEIKGDAVIYSITVKEVQAINQKCKELQWI